MILTDQQLGPPVFGGPFAEPSDPAGDIRASLGQLGEIEAGWNAAVAGWDNQDAWRARISIATTAVNAAASLVGADDVFASSSGAEAYDQALAEYGTCRAALATSPDQVPTPGLLDGILALFRDPVAALGGGGNGPTFDGTKIAIYGIGAVALLIFLRRVL